MHQRVYERFSWSRSMFTAYSQACNHDYQFNQDVRVVFLSEHHVCLLSSFIVFICANVLAFLFSTKYSPRT